MKLKEKIITESAEAAVTAAKKTVNPAAAFFISALLGFLAAGTRLGGNGAPLCTALTAVISPLGGFAAFGGAMAAFFLDGTIQLYVTEIISMPAVIIARAMITSVFGRKITPVAAGALACASYIICGIAVAFSFKITAALILAVFFRSVLCGGAAFFTEKAFSCAERDFVISAENCVSVSVVYMLLICMLCGISFGAVNAGRVAGLFFTAAAAFRYGIPGGAAAGALSAFAFGAASASMAPSAAIVVCAGLASGLLFKKNKLLSAGVFIAVVFAGALVYGMPSDTVKLIPEAAAASAAFCIIPEKLYRRSFGRTAAAPSAAALNYGAKLKFAASAVSDVRASFAKAAKVLENGGNGNDISKEVCSKVCTLCRSSVFCGEDEKHRIDSYFRPAENILKSKGFITEKELHKALECCPKKNELAEAFNEMYRLSQIEKRYGDVTDCMREITLEQLSETEDMLGFLSQSADVLSSCDEVLSEYVREALEESGVKEPAAAVFFDRDGRIFIECFYEGLLNVKLEELTERLGSITDRELDEPTAVSLNRVTHLCFQELPAFAVEVGRAKVSGREQTSGDSDTSFRDSMGNLCILISDGMGSGVRAAVESCMTVSLMTRIIRAGLGTDAAVRLINRLLLTKSAEEIFATVDLLRINLFTGRAEVVKLGAAQTFFKTNGTVKTVESWSTPVGIVSSVEICRRSVQLSDGDSVVMITDGICEECFPRVRELMLSVGVTVQECAERIVAAAENGMEEDLCRCDDKTVYVVKIHKI